MKRIRLNTAIHIGSDGAPTSVRQQGEEEAWGFGTLCFVGNVLLSHHLRIPEMIFCLARTSGTI